MGQELNDARYLEVMREMCVGRTITNVIRQNGYMRFCFDNGGYQEFRELPGGYTFTQEG